MESWHCIINGYASNGLGDDGLEMYEQMRKVGLVPNEETFLAVLYSCAGADAIKEAFLHFEEMQEYGIKPKIEHYLGLIGVFGKKGDLAEALEYVEKLPFEASILILILFQLRVCVYIKKNGSKWHPERFKLKILKIHTVKNEVFGRS
ncbi:putative tetratricopeptide-like helical domain superfamily, pentacotripeptide-repeat region of PRORP [Helianthus anomalus]